MWFIPAVHLLCFYLFRVLNQVTTMRLLSIVLLVVGCVYADDDEKKESVGTVVGIDLGTTYSW